MKRQVFKGHCITLGLLLVMAMGLAHANDVSGTWLDSSGAPIRWGEDSCLRSGSWARKTAHPDCDPSRVVLLPGPDGKVGAVIVETQMGAQVLDKAYAGVVVGQQGSLTARQETAASVNQRYGAALQAQPMRPVSYTVQCAFGSATELTPESFAVIEEVKADLATRPAPEITVIGHTDRVGTNEANDVLSLRRAETVRNILLAAGLKAVRIESAGRGMREPLVPTADQVAEARNRRVEISIR